MGSTIFERYLASIPHLPLSDRAVPSRESSNARGPSLVTSVIARLGPLFVIRACSDPDAFVRLAFRLIEGQGANLSAKPTLFLVARA